MSEFLISHKEGFPFGYTAITKIGEVPHDTGINFGILKIKKGEQFSVATKLESALLLLQGECEAQLHGKTKMASRFSLFNEAPFVIHLATQTALTLKAITDCEFAVSEVNNPVAFNSCFYDENTLLENEERGKGLLNDTACRIVRTIFDTRNCPDSKLVLGEVITAPGRWSSYPPHHHPHPEIYHYRFTEAQGYGHAECGETVFKVKQYDTYKILHENDHAQTAAPGYGMYYLWVIRHLDNNPYVQPDFTEAHKWTKEAQANSRVWQSNF